jgi:1-aminocyclopropane-1-carboxylate deaminase/D-cysteine desulfhydrase-like pyridoxal-dependent ACC family enzyme
VQGGDFFVHQLAERLRAQQGRNCYEVPCGGSNVLGTFGYLHAVTELMQQASDCDGAQATFPYDHIVFGCGSGGTAAGLAIGAHLAGLDVQLHAVGVCDSPDEFYEVVRHKAEALGLQGETQTEGERLPPLHEEVRSWLKVWDGQGEGYAQASEAELQFLLDVSSQTGVALDPVYSGKALFAFCTSLLPAHPEVFRPGHKVLFVHTGGALGNYSKSDQLLPLLRTDISKDIEPL